MTRIVSSNIRPRTN